MAYFRARVLAGASEGLAKSSTLQITTRASAFAFRAVFSGMLAPLFYLFFAVFPVQSPLDRHLPWLKWVGLLFGVCVVVPGLRTGSPSFPRVLAHWLGRRNANFINAGSR